MRKIARWMKEVMECVLFLLTGKGPAAEECIRAGVIDYSGQGRDKYGR